MPVNKKNWQTTKPTIIERSKHMFNNDLFSDVKFVVRGANGESESKRVIPVHKFVLSISSPVFEAMFYGELAETKDTIELPDCEYDSLLEFFRYIYSDEAILSGSNVMGVLYLAKKYMVPSLAEKCAEYLQEHIDSSNVFRILPSAQKYEERNLVDRCWEVIDEQTEQALKSDGFETIDRSLLEAVVVRDTLSIREVNLFTAVNLWATKECERQGLAANGEVKRRMLGDPIVKGIRFPVMKQIEFANVVADCKILTPEEIIAIFKYYSSALNSPLEFTKTNRFGGYEGNIHHCRRFTSVLGFWWYHRGQTDYLKFTVDKDIILHGVCLFGIEDGDYSVILTMKKEGGSALVSKKGTFHSKLLDYKIEKYYGFQVMFDSAVELRKDARYQIAALISGPRSSCGRCGVRSVVSSGVTFTFTNDATGGNGTNTEQGQFPEILFSVIT